MSIQSFAVRSRSWFLSVLVLAILLSAAAGTSQMTLLGSPLSNDVGEHTLPAMAGDHQGGTGSG